MDRNRVSYSSVGARKFALKSRRRHRRRRRRRLLLLLVLRRRRPFPGDSRRLVTAGLPGCTKRLPHNGGRRPSTAMCRVTSLHVMAAHCNRSLAQTAAFCLVSYQHPAGIRAGRHTRAGGPATAPDHDPDASPRASRRTHRRPDRAAPSPAAAQVSGGRQSRRRRRRGGWPGSGRARSCPHPFESEPVQAGPRVRSTRGAQRRGGERASGGVAGGRLGSPGRGTAGARR